MKFATLPTPSSQYMSRIRETLWVRHFEFWNPLAQLHIHICHIPKFQNNPSSGYWELVRKKPRQKEKEEEEEEEETEQKKKK